MTTVPVRTPSVSHQMTFGDLTRMLASLPQDAILYGDFGGRSDIRYSLYPELKLAPSFHHDWDVQFELDFSDEPVTVGDVLDFLLIHRDRPIPHNPDYLVTDESYVYVGNAANAGCINGIRMNSDGSFALSTEHPYA
jgi:hypothetical protein